MFIRNRMVFAPADEGAAGAGAGADAGSDAAKAAAAAGGAGAGAGADAGKTGAGGAGASGDGAGADAGKAADWRTAIKDAALQEHAKRFTTLEDVIKGNLELRSERDRLQSTAIVKPAKLPDNASDAQKQAHTAQTAAYRKAMDIPDEGTVGEKGYQFAKPEFMSDEAFKSEGTQAVLGAIAKHMHELGAPRSVVQGAWNLYAQLEGQAMKQAVEADKKFTAEAEAKLRQELGSEEAFIAHKEFGRRAVVQMAKMAGVDADALMKIETKDGRFVMDHPVMVKIWGKLGREMGESTLGPVITGSDRAGLETQIQAKRDEINRLQAEGKGDAAQKAYEELLSMRARLGNGPIVGAGRAA